MTIVSKSWRNADGLNVWFGPNEGKAGLAGEVLTFGDNRSQEYTLTLTDLTTTAQVLDEHVDLPTGAFIEQVEIVVLTAATSGGSATLNLGILDDDDVTNVSDTALVNALALSSINTAGQKVVLNVGSTGAGASIGSIIAGNLNGLVTGKAGTAVYTAGKLLIRVLWNTAGQLTSINSAKDV